MSLPALGGPNGGLPELRNFTAPAESRDEVLQVTLSPDPNDNTSLNVYFAGKNVDPNNDEDVIAILLFGLESLGVDTSELKRS